MSFLLLALFTTFIAVVVVSWHRLDVAGDGTAAACRPEDVLAALQWEVKGTYEAGRFAGVHRDRKVEIRIQAGHYRIAIEGIPEAGDLEGAEAVRAIRALAGGKRRDAGVSDWEAILHVFHAHPFRFEGGWLVSKAPMGGGVLGANDEATRLKRLLDRLVEVTKVAQLALTLRANIAARTHCPYCHDSFSTEPIPTTECPKCSARHHVACFEEYGRCAVFGCSANAPTGLRDSSGPREAAKGSIRSV